MEKQDMTMKYGGRVVKVELYVNSEEEHYHLLKRIKRAARGERMNAALILLSVYEGEEGQKVWKVIQGLIDKHPGTTELD